MLNSRMTQVYRHTETQTNRVLKEEYHVHILFCVGVKLGF